MRTWWLVAMLVCSSAVAAASPDLVLTWKEGEQSRDSSMMTVKIIVSKTKLHYTRKHTGRTRLPDKEINATVKDPQRVAATLAALDKIKTRSVDRSKESTQYRIRTGCIVMRGKPERCAYVSGQAADPEDLVAIAAVRDALLEDVKLD